MFYQFHITQNCNLSCKYCIESNKDSNKRMTENTAIKSVEYVVNHFLANRTDDEQCINCNITGGEPFLQFDILKTIIEEMTSKSRENKLTKPNFEISTNATLFNRKHFEYLKGNNFTLFIGFDGISDSHDTNRLLKSNSAGSYQIVKDNISNYCLSDPSIKPITYLNMVVTPNNVIHMYKNYQYLYELLNGEYDRISLSIAHEQDWDKNSLTLLEIEISKFVELYIHTITKSDKDFSIGFLEDQIVRTLINREYQPTDCGAVNKSFAISTDGKIFACGGFSYMDLDENDIVIGDVFNGIDQILVNKYFSRAQHLNLEECHSCEFINRCFNYCPVSNFAGSHKMGEISVNDCEIKKILIYASEKIIDEIYRINKSLLYKRYDFVETGD